MIERFLARLNARVGYIPVRQKLLTAFAVLSALLLGLGGVTGNVLVSSALDEAILRSLTAEVDSLKAVFDASLREVEHDLELLANSPHTLEAARGRDDSSHVQLRDELERFLISKDGYLRLRLLDGGASEIIAISRLGEPAPVSTPEPFYLYRLAGYPRGATVRTSVELAAVADPGVVPAISFARGLYQGDDLLGILVADLSAESVFPDSLLPMGDDGAVMVVDREGRFLYHSEFLDDWNEFLASRGQLSLRERYPAQVAEQILAGMAGGSVRSNGDIVYFRPILEGEPDQLILLRTAVRADVLAPARQLRFVFFGLLVAAMLLSAAIAHGAAQHFTSSIQALESGARDLAEGNYSHRFEHESYDELDEIARSFNEMAAAIQNRDRRIREHAADLEDEVRRRTEDLLRAERMAAAGELVSGIAHEVASPLNIISGYAEHLLYEVSGNETMERDLGLIVGETSRIADLVRSLQDLARPQPPVRSRLDLVPLAAEVGRLLTGTARQRGVAVEVDAPPEPVQVYASPSELKQMILNLAINAVHASEPGSVVTIAVRADDRGAVVRVEDTGSGIPAAALDQIFEPFYTTKPAGEGTGLGLAIVRRIVDQHGGRITVDSEQQRGTRFEVVLPAEPTNAA